MIEFTENKNIFSIFEHYASKSDKTDVVVEEFHNWEKVSSLTKKGKITMIIGDFKAKVDCGEEGECVVRYGPADRNTRDDRLLNSVSKINFCYLTHSLKFIRGDYIPGNSETRGDRIYKVYENIPGTGYEQDIIRDHNSVVLNLKMKRNRQIKKVKHTQQVDIDPLLRLQLNVKSNKRSPNCSFFGKWKCNQLGRV